MSKPTRTWTDERQHAMSPSFSFSCTANDSMAKVQVSEKAGILRESSVASRTNGRNIFPQHVRCESGGHPSASGKKHTLSFRLDAATSAIVHCSHNQIQIGHHRTVSMTCCLPHVLVTLMQLCCVCVSFRQRGVDLTFCLF